jgi:hypothetical protein
MAVELIKRFVSLEDTANLVPIEAPKKAGSCKTKVI